jgi:hypothetical protein
MELRKPNRKRVLQAFEVYLIKIKRGAGKCFLHPCFLLNSLKPSTSSLSVVPVDLVKFLSPNL